MFNQFYRASSSDDDDDDDADADAEVTVEAVEGGATFPYDDVDGDGGS